MALENFRDQFGFLIHIHKNLTPDRGDAAQRTFTDLLFRFHTEPGKRIANAEEVEELCKSIQCSSGEYVRHPDGRDWPGQEGIMSRDNLNALLRCLCVYAKYSHAIKRRKWKLFWSIIKRGGFLWNTKHIDPKPDEKWKLPDFIGLTLMTAFFRGSILAWPFLACTDLILGFNAVLLSVKGAWDKYECGHDLNYQNDCVHASVQGWTPTAWVARQLYGALRPNPAYKKAPLYTGKRIDGYAPYSVWKCYYWNKKSHPPMYEIAKPIVNKFF